MPLYVNFYLFFLDGGTTRQWIYVLFAQIDIKKNVLYGYTIYY